MSLLTWNASLLPPSALSAKGGRFLSASRSGHDDILRCYIRECANGPHERLRLNLGGSGKEPAVELDFLSIAVQDEERSSRKDRKAGAKVAEKNAGGSFPVVCDTLLRPSTLESLL